MNVFEVRGSILDINTRLDEVFRVHEGIPNTGGKIEIAVRVRSDRFRAGMRREGKTHEVKRRNDRDKKAETYRLVPDGPVSGTGGVVHSP